MASWSRRERTRTWVEYALPVRSNWGEVGKVVAAIRQELGEERARWDDVVEVIGGDEEIVFRYVKEPGATS